MSASGEYLDWLVESLTPLGPVAAQRMFGGAGLFLDGLMFALVADETLFFKVDAVNLPAFEAAGLAPFTYLRGERRLALSYREAPADCLDEPEILVEWAEIAVGAARRTHAAKPARPARPTKRAEPAKKPRKP